MPSRPLHPNLFGALGMLLHYSDDGPGPAVVLLHGFPLDHTIWDEQRTTLGSMYRVIAPDLRGHGASAATEGAYTMEVLADDVIETLDALGLTEPLVVGGLSMGGYVALAMAFRYPRRLRGLMLVNTRAAADTPETARVREDLAQQVEASGSVEAVVQTMLPKLVSPTTLRLRPELLDPVQRVMAGTSALGVAGSLRGMAARPDRTADLPRIAVPTLVIAGE